MWTDEIAAAGDVRGEKKKSRVCEKWNVSWLVKEWQ